MDFIDKHFLKILTLVLVVLFVSILTIALFKRIDPAMSGTASIIIGGVVSMLTGVIGYWFGSSKGSADKTQIMSDQSKQP